MSVRYFKRHRKTGLALLALAIIVGLLALRELTDEVERYTAGESAEGLTDQYASQEATPGPNLRFNEVAEELGLRFQHFPGMRSNRLPEDMGGGVALGDFDGDGWTDVFLTNSNGPMNADGEVATAARSRLFRNVAGSFTDVTEKSGIDLRAQAMAAAFCDVDSDGDLDLFATTFGFCRLYLNQGDGRFVDESERAGLTQYEGFWTGIGVGDYNTDGAIDLYVCGYVRYDEKETIVDDEASPYGVSIPARINPSNFDPIANLLLMGNGDGTFVERAEEAGVDDPKGRSLGVLFCDLNLDGLPDLYVANDVSDNALLINRGDGTFADCTSLSNTGDYRGAMGLAAADFDGDQDLDLFITHWVSQENALYQLKTVYEKTDEPLKVPFFNDQAHVHRLGFQGLRSVGWATRFVDIDNDGALDLFVVNGSTIPLAEDASQLAPERSDLFWNSQSKDRYVEVGQAQAGFFAEKYVGRGGATFDFDLDGDEDLVVVRRGGATALLRNDGGNAKACVRLRLRQTEGNRFALGAKVVVTVGGKQLFDILGTQGSYLSQHAVGELAFGLGDDSVVESIEVVWPNGESETEGPFPGNSLIEWTKGQRPRAQFLPGRLAFEQQAPENLEDQRRFFSLRKQASAARLSGDAATAIGFYLQALALWPGHADCLYYIGNSYLATHEEAKALAAFTRLVQVDEHSNAGFMQIGLIHLPGGDERLDDIGEARRAFESSRALNQEESRPVLQLGIVAMLQRDFDQALSNFRDVCRQNPRSIEARWFAGKVAYMQGDRKLAEHYLTEARSLCEAKGAGDSASNEGDTVSGSSMTAEEGVKLAADLTHWRETCERSGSIDDEFRVLGTANEVSDILPPSDDG